MEGLIWLLTCQVPGYLVSVSIFDYRTGEIRIGRLPSLGHLILALVWLYSTFAIWLQFGTGLNPYCNVLIVIELLLFPVLGAIDLDVRKVPDKLLILGSVACGADLYFYLGFPGLLKSFSLAICYALPLVVVNLVKPGSIGGGDIKLGYVLAAVLTPVATFFTVLEMLLVANILAIFAYPALRYMTVSPWRGIPMVPFLTFSVMLISFKIL